MKYFNKIIAVLIFLICASPNLLSHGNENGNNLLGELFPDATFVCRNAHERCGYSMSGAGDVNGDGFDDFMVAAYHNYVHGWNSGGVYLITGGLNISWGFNVNIESAATAIFRGSVDYDMVGYNVSGKGDFNGDGFDDLIIGAPGTWDRNPAIPGWVYIVYGKREMNWGKDCQLALSADIKLVGENNLDQLGYANAFVGDLNHDGFDDIICGAPYRNYYSKWDGKAYLILGDSTGWNETNLVAQKAVASFYYPFEEALVGYSVAGVGDVNQDGTPDFVIGVPGANMACLILGRTNVNWGHDFNLANADYKFIGEFEGDFAGSWISPANDINQDGHADFLISAIKSFFEGGRIYLILGRNSWTNQEISLASADASFRGEDVETHTGFCTSGLKDYDGDGFDDFLIGARYLNNIDLPHAGKMYLIKGRSSGWQHDYNLEYIQDYFWGDDSITCAGWQVADVGDVNGDNAHDFATSGPFNSSAEHWGGKIYFFYGKNISYQINGSVNYYRQDHPIGDTKLLLTGAYWDSTISDIAGKYSFSVRPNYSYQIAPSRLFEQGENEFVISAYDAALVAQHAMELDTLDNFSGLAADVDRDNKICMYDAAQIARYAVDLPPFESSHAGEFLFNPQSRSYEMINCSYQNQDYVGVLLGDVDGNWQMNPLVNIEKVADGSLLPATIFGCNNLRISIPIRLNNEPDVNSAEMRIRYDPEQLEFIDIKTTELSKNFEIVFNVEPQGMLRIAMYTTSPASLNGEFIHLAFKITNKKRERSTILHLAAFRINDLYPVSDQTRIIIGDKRHLEIQNILTNQPNPFNPTTTIIYQNSVSGQAKLVIYDMLGKEVRSFDLGYLEAGVHELFWDGKDNNGIDLTSGIYFIKFNCEKKILINKMIKLK